MAYEIETSPAEDRATLVTGSEAADNSIVYTAVEREMAGNAVTVAHIDPAGNDVALSVAVTGSDIAVTLSTDGASAPDSTADEVKDAIIADAEASALVTVSSVGASTGDGLVAALAETALTGGVASKVSSVHTNTVITDPEAENAVQIPPEADATGRDELDVHTQSSPVDQIEALS